MPTFNPSHTPFYANIYPPSLTSSHPPSSTPSHPLSSTPSHPPSSTPSHPPPLPPFIHPSLPLPIPPPLPLPIVTAINDFQHVVRYWGNYLHDLEAENPQQAAHSNQKLTSRWCLTAILVNKPLMQDLVTFCEAASYSLLGALCGYDVVDGTHALPSSATATATALSSGAGAQGQGLASSNLEGSWLVSAADCPPTQLALLTSLPEHLVEDIVAILLFVAKTEPAVLSHSTTSLRSALSLVLFLLRRPWAVQSPHLRAKLGHLLWKVTDSGAVLATHPSTSLGHILITYPLTTPFYTHFYMPSQMPLKRIYTLSFPLSLAPSHPLNHPNHHPPPSIMPGLSTVPRAGEE